VDAVFDLSLQFFQEKRAKLGAHKWKAFVDGIRCLWYWAKQTRGPKTGEKPSPQKPGKKASDKEPSPPKRTQERNKVPPRAQPASPAIVLSVDSGDDRKRIVSSPTGSISVSTRTPGTKVVPAVRMRALEEDMDAFYAAQTGTVVLASKPRPTAVKPPKPRAAAPTQTRQNQAPSKPVRSVANVAPKAQSQAVPAPASPRPSAPVPESPMPAVLRAVAPPSAPRPVCKRPASVSGMHGDGQHPSKTRALAQRSLSAPVSLAPASTGRPEVFGTNIKATDPVDFVINHYWTSACMT
jgi:hypothetical protein